MPVAKTKLTPRRLWFTLRFFYIPVYLFDANNFQKSNYASTANKAWYAIDHSTNTCFEWNPLKFTKLECWNTMGKMATVVAAVGNKPSSLERLLIHSKPGYRAWSDGEGCNDDA